MMKVRTWVRVRVRASVRVRGSVRVRVSVRSVRATARVRVRVGPNPSPNHEVRTTVQRAARPLLPPPAICPLLPPPALPGRPLLPPPARGERRVGGHELEVCAWFGLGVGVGSG